MWLTHENYEASRVSEVFGEYTTEGVRVTLFETIESSQTSAHTDEVCNQSRNFLGLGRIRWLLHRRSDVDCVIIPFAMKSESIPYVT